MEAWGASGNTSRTGCWNGYCSKIGGSGGYTSGKIEMNSEDELYLYIGHSGANARLTTAYNGGAASSSTGCCGSSTSYGGGGSTDVRLISGDWNNTESLNSRIMVAGAGGGATAYSNAGHGGGLYGHDICASHGGCNNDDPDNLYIPSSQIQAGVERIKSTGTVKTVTVGYFGKGGNGVLSEDGSTGHLGGGGGGSGYYGGSGGLANSPGQGGSSYISGHTGSVAIAEGSTSEPRSVKISGCTTGTSDNDCSIHYSGKYFINTLMIDGAGYKWTTSKQGLELMPNPEGGYYSSGVGHSGDGYARITYLGTTN